MASIRKVFRWSVEAEKDLLREVVGNRPYTAAEWNKVAQTLVSAWSASVEQPSSLSGAMFNISGRSVREHTELMVKHYKAENRAALKKSGTEEDYGELAQLLEDHVSHSDARPLTPAKTAVDDSAQRQTAVNIRQAAMQTLRGRGDNADETADVPENKRKKEMEKRSSKSDLLRYLEEKNATEAALKRESLELERRRLDLQERQMDFKMQLLQRLMNQGK